ncbi:manganese efflux pump MntP family protein [Bacillus sp. DX1.1]|uniref:manganese efflux pump MntP n=1 Tax=unclassified Bacillus (in: firmicutes) TaxID=185979 RepID=UPI00257128C1|nr:MULTISPECIES: manganese efflux pump MntP family protein [unclassified Bacillus (in: firmicutes)]MDM5157446.1 manganese efflux pump MntP family protein [Bacillus sp. DX1.1]WJE81667.1 manganese efflux pump MntP family protein [Bacillus sp. DX3.1]
MTVEQLLPLFIMAFALGLDAFSVSLGMGMVALRMRQILYIGITIGLFHIVMPFLGMVLGRFLSEQLGHMATIAGAILLVGLGFYIIYSSMLEGEETRSAPVGVSLLLFAFSVSIDSFSVGLSLGIYGAQTIITILIFGLVSMVLAWSGLLIGRRVKRMLGIYGEVLGGIILVGFGLILLFPI